MKIINTTLISLTLLFHFTLNADSIVHGTFINIKQERSLGSETGILVDSAKKLIDQHKYVEANILLDEVILKFEKIIKMDNKETLYRCFLNKEEFIEYQNQTKKKIIWLDESYSRAYYFKAYIHVDKKELEIAKKLLLIANKLAPFAANIFTELAFISSREGNKPNAFMYYKKALELSNQFDSQKVWKAMALRGIGSTLIDLKDLNKAEEYFNESLKIDPHNKIALNELAYIDDLRKAN
ncbi:tetratricopeptide repeat protein [Sulfurimonas sp.]|uniref:tetratricopeptide repeat protein n=1 Tax=Sulfurimonas sp. TaxID=2022749 RepID=UPI002B483962|nr:tetratricopeptide repeat protein [Sulfurimonas sp.]